jgi:hypothetical protein
MSAINIRPTTSWFTSGNALILKSPKIIFKHPSKKLQTMAELKRRLKDTEPGALERAEANTMKLIGRKRV